jgi:hypothetical protein
LTIQDQFFYHSESSEVPYSTKPKKVASDLMINFVPIIFFGLFFVERTTGSIANFLYLCPFESLTPNTPLIHTSFTYPKLNMDEIYGLKFYLLYVLSGAK